MGTDLPTLDDTQQQQQHSSCLPSTLQAEVSSTALFSLVFLSFDIALTLALPHSQ